MQACMTLAEHKAHCSDCAQTADLCLAAPAKINLYLGVFPHDEGHAGYHKVDTLMAAIELFDWVHISFSKTARANSIDMTPSFDVAPEENIALIAANRMCEVFHRPQNIMISIQKHILPQSGLGGSSSDAAAVIRGLCAQWKISLADARVRLLARSIGADVAFFLNPFPSFMQGVGNEFVRSYALKQPIYCALMRPEKGQSTPCAYRIFDAHPSTPTSPSALMSFLETGDIDALARSLYNNLAEALMQDDAELVRARDWIAAQPEALSCLLSGSGTAFFALCKSKEAADSLCARAAKVMKWWTDSTQVLGMHAEV